ncbi:hypothetical protein L198_00110 [Cryptococcus wingfieldii CBS 7118]|uniref:Uncharacterized protein n=1 Tax=Cryptococcus wingfieldii CBS 7118 TaxID=1295528 RepID=A0A1E3K5U4_9TREE|nr:hypothetical protein L198_00110 [Cryptococcus wingfieldii CBS 7118]ODO08385.1 hypothetical protein L198_00110 [Cryptococcus wingfieldii CBS 7118]
MVPSLLYHSSTPAFYPTNTAHSLLVLRFSAPARVASVRIIPEGVRSLVGQGVTYPHSWSGQLLFNISPSNPVNALVSTTIDYEGGDHAVDYPIDMPEGTVSRMIMLRAPVEQLTISVYGYTNPSDEAAVPIEASDISSSVSSLEDYSWLWTWAGDSPTALLDCLSSSADSAEISRALECLDLLAETDKSVLSATLESDQYLFSILQHPSSPFAKKLLDDWTYASQPPLSELLPNDHPFKPLLHPSSSERHTAAWENLSIGVPALSSILQHQTQIEEDDLLRVEPAERRSNLSRLLELGERFAKEEDSEGLRLVLDLLHKAQVQDVLVWRQLVGVVPRWTTISNVLDPNYQRSLSITSGYARQVLANLLLASSEVVGKKLAFPEAKRLAGPYLAPLSPDDPLRTCFSSPPPHPSTPAMPSSTESAFLQTLSQPPLSPSQSSKTPSLPLPTLLNLLAPHLTQSLSTAISPPFSIPPSYCRIEGQEGPGANASAWGGKVYSSHEFRSREMFGGGGLGIGGAGGGGGVIGGRAASKHVDQYETA